MATTTFTTMIPTPSAKTTATKRPGPPVPPRPQQSSLLRTQRDAAGAGGAAANLPQRSSSKVGLEQPQILKKPAPVAATTSGNAASGGRTVIYKSPSLNLQKRQEEREKRGSCGESSTTTTKANAVTQTTTSSTAKLTNGTHAPKPPLKLRKAPDVPTAKARIQTASDATSPTQQSAATTATTTPTPTANVTDENRDNNNIVIVQSSQGSVTLNRHHSMNTPSSHTKSPSNLKDSRLSLGRADFERVGNKINLSQLQPTTQPLPRPRKIVKIPVATMDVDVDTNSLNSTSTTTSSSSNSHGTSTLGVSLFKRSKTTLDHFTSRAHITTVSTGTAGGYLSGKTVEIKNNLKNAAERLFSEIMVNQQKHESAVGLSNMVITKHERAIQHQTMVETPSQTNVTVVNTGSEEGPASKGSDNCTRINIITTTPTHTANNGQKQEQEQQQQSQQQQQQQLIGVRQVVSAFNSPEKKSAAFHEMLISELAAMRTRSCSMENLQTKSHGHEPQQEQQQRQLQLQFKAGPTPKTLEIKTNNKMQDEQSNPDDDIDADNVEDADGDGDDDGEDEGQDIEKVLKKSLKVISANNQNSPRKRTPSGCSSDSSPYGTERSSRIRTSDWIEVGDNGKQVTLTSCHISLEDSGLEDEERMDEMSSSGVGDSWDSVKEAEQYNHHQQQQQQHHLIQQDQQQQTKRSSRSVKRIMSINDLPPLPKSLSGINKMLASDSGLISDVDTEMARNAKNSESQKENNSNSSNNNNNNSNISIKDTGDKLNNSTLIMAATATATSSSSSSTTTTTAAAGSASANETTTTTTPLKEINGNETISEIPPAIPGSKLDNQIATLRKEMFGLRQLDLTLLSQLWALNDSIQEFRTMIQENEQEDDETYSTHSRSPSPYDSVSSDGDDEISALKGKKLLDMQNANNNASVITTQPKLTPKSYAPENETTTKLANNRTSTASGMGGNDGGVGAGVDMSTFQSAHLMKPPLPKPLDVKPVPRMRSAPPPPPTHRKSQNAPPRPT